MPNREIEVFMVGGRRCGKTSVLAAMNDCAARVLSRTNIDFIMEEGITDLPLKCNEVMNACNDLGLFVPDYQPSQDLERYTCKISIGSYGTDYDIKFVDVPGEWFMSSEHEAEIMDHLKSSAVIIIAIDSPALMEDIDDNKGYGKRHIEYNRVNEITRLLENAFQKDESLIKNKLVMFTPIRCERYYWLQQDGHEDGKMDELFETVIKGYSGLFNHFLKPSLKDNIDVRILPLITAGGIQFAYFDDETYMAKYQQVTNHKGYNPKFCEMPLLYVIKYQLEQALNLRPKNFLLGPIDDWIRHRGGRAAKQEYEEALSQVDAMLKGNFELK